MKDDIEKLKKENAILRAGIEAVRQFITESYGVVGLHLNHDDAPRDELLSGGDFEHWLDDFSEAMDMIDND